ncbi:MAG: hypothetical protein ACOX2F_09065 [bacterium]
MFSRGYAVESNNFEELASETWAIILKELAKEEISFEKKMLLIDEFIAKSPEKSKARVEAEIFKKSVKNSKSQLNHLANRKLYVNKTEWMALAFVGGNYGLGFTISFCTFRWEYFFWESLRLQFTMLESLGSIAINGKTMVGIPFFYGFANQHELRLSAGLAGGLSEHKYIFLGQKKKNSKSVIIVRDVDSITVHMSIPLEISYVFHINKFFALQTGLILDMPVCYENFRDTYYIPSFSGFIGFRL